MRVQLVDPSAFTPPYDRALAAALARGGAEGELVTTKFLYGLVPEAEGYEVDERFYKRSAARGLGSSARLPFKGAEHLRDMLAFRRAPSDADVVHYQWLTLPRLDRRILPPTRPPGVTAHGASASLPRLPEEKPLPEELQGAEGPVVLSFGLLRPYKGLENLLEAFTEVKGAELWIVGNPRMAVEPLHEAAALTGAKVRFVTRFVEDAEIPAIFRAADVVALPYLDAEHSGVLYTALAFGKPMVVSAVGGFPEVADAGAARLVPPGDTGALAAAPRELVGDPSAREG